MKKNNFKNFCIGLGVLLFYLIGSTFCYEITSIFIKNFDDLNIIIKQIYLILYQTILTLIIVYIYTKDLIPNFKDFIKNNIKYFKKYIKYWFLMLGLMMASNAIIILFVTTSTPQNQQAIIDTLISAPIYIFIISVLIAPILEELVFRLSFRKMFEHSNILFILFSGLFFGGMHVIGSLENLIDLIFIIPYSIPGFIFAYIYTKSKNIFIPISLHFIHNGIMMGLQIILLLTK